MPGAADADQSEKSGSEVVSIPDRVLRFLCRAYGSASPGAGVSIPDRVLRFLCHLTFIRSRSPYETFQSLIGF